MKQLPFYIAIVIPFIFSACSKIDVPKDTPACIKKMIKEDTDGWLSKVYEYDYLGEKVFKCVPSPELIDAAIVVYDSDCNFICMPGQLNNKCPDFSENASNENLIWEK